jgi:5-methylcytosine-specific restriction endonuclease McrA
MTSLTTIMGLLNQVSTDEVVLPAIQRDFVWSEAQTEILLDSIMRGYPIGIALLWETHNDIQYRSFEREFRHGTVHSYRANPERRRLRIVLDGQQRLQSLYIALYGQRDGRAVHFDLLSGQRWDDAEEERYLFDFLATGAAKTMNDETLGEAESREDDDETPCWWIAVRELFTMPGRARRDLAKDLTSRLKLTDDEAVLLEENLGAFDEAFTRNQNILKLSTIDENLPSDSPYRKTETDVLEIFVRINREGTALSRSDLIFSMLKLNWKESAEGLPEFVEAINQGNSFDLDTDFVVRCLFAVSGLGGKLEIDLLRKRTNIEKLQGNFDSCCDAIRATVDFVQGECGCQSSALLGNSTALVPVAHYMFGLPKREVPNDQVDRLRTAVYLFGLARPLSRWGESRVGNFARTVLDSRSDGDHRFPLEDTIQKVRGWERIDSIEDLAEANHGLTLHLIQGLSGARVQYSRNAPEVDHIFPRSELRNRNHEEEDINDLANFWILAQGKNRNKSNRRPKDYFQDVSADQLDKALIDREMLDYRRFRRFIRERRETMLKLLSTKLHLTDADLERV